MKTGLRFGRSSRRTRAIESEASFLNFSQTQESSVSSRTANEVQRRKQSLCRNLAPQRCDPVGRAGVLALDDLWHVTDQLSSVSSRLHSSVFR